MKKLIDCCDVRHENGTFLLIPRQADEIDLVMLGFDGTEKWIRLETKETHSNDISNATWNYTATICKADGHTWSWCWGFNGHTLVSAAVEEKRKKIIEAVKTYCVRNGMQIPGRGW